MMLATVVTAAYATVPARFLTTPQHWTARDQAIQDEAMTACYDRALKVNPNNAKAHCGLGGILLRQGRTKEALAQLRTAVGSNPS